MSRRNTRVAVDNRSERISRAGSFEGGLGRILDFPPLLKAFEEFCLKALCIEVRWIYEAMSCM